MKLLIAFVSVLGLAGCASHAKRVNCDWYLTPINPPAAVAAEPEA